MIKERLNTYTEEHCWQYDIRLKNFDEDLLINNLTKEYIETLKVSDFTFKNIIDKDEQKNLKKFIERHEWLGKLSMFTTHWFACYHKDIMAGVILFNVPNALSKLLGDDTKNLERLISRGACISWSPKNLASSFLMWCIKWMVKNTQYRIFTAYSDPSAKEIGTIYQACNFYYVGQYGKYAINYINPFSGKTVSDRFFRQKSAYKKYAKILKIKWEKNWNHSQGMNWNNIPDDIEKKLRDYSKYIQNKSEKIIIPSKHKYAYVLGKSKFETKQLRKIYELKNKILPYPKQRGK
jgi:hypothetical protein